MKRYLLFAAVGLLAFSISGCAGLSGSAGVPGSSSNSGGGLNDLVTFTKADLDKAESNSVAACNANPASSLCVVIPCPPALEKWIDATAGAAGQLQVSGLFSGLTAGQAVVDGVQQGVPNDVYVGCGPAYMKFKVDLLKLLGKATPLGLIGG